MQEFFTKAIVLDRLASGEADARVSLYTETRGRITARVRSVRKMTSKLSNHLQPLNIIETRVLETSGFQVVDALTTGRFKRTGSMIQLMRLIKELTAEGHKDDQLWQTLSDSNLQASKVLKSLGLDASHALCHECEQAAPRYFIPKDMQYACEMCVRVQTGQNGRFILNIG